MLFNASFTLIVLRAAT